MSVFHESVTFKVRNQTYSPRGGQTLAASAGWDASFADVVMRSIPTVQKYFVRFPCGPCGRTRFNGRQLGIYTITIAMTFVPLLPA
jgi:hypothetical protein